MRVTAKKSLGQNFLKDEYVLKDISSQIDPNEDDLILEIGPGKGALTKYLIQKNCNYIGYEIDERMKPILTSLSNNIIFCDFLQSDLSRDLSDYSYKKLYVVANIPYYITTPIIEHLMSFSIHLTSMVLLVQKEVAERFSAKSGTKNYGYFTVYLNYFFSVTKLFDVSRFAFEPVPNVESSVVLFERKNSSYNINQEDYFSFLKKCFANKRKTLKNNLKDYDWDKIFLVLKQNGFQESVRAEEISSQIFLEIFQVL